MEAEQSSCPEKYTTGVWIRQELQRKDNFPYLKSFKKKNKQTSGLRLRMTVIRKAALFEKGTDAKVI